MYEEKKLDAMSIMPLYIYIIPYNASAVQRISYIICAYVYFYQSVFRGVLTAL